MVNGRFQSQFRDTFGHGIKQDSIEELGDKDDE